MKITSCFDLFSNQMILCRKVSQNYLNSGVALLFSPMDQPKVSSIDNEKKPRTSIKSTTRTIPGANVNFTAVPADSDSGFNSADSTDSVDQVVSPPVLLHLRLAKQETNERRVGFHDGVVDNEHSNRRKSKCCCIYRKPHPFGESSSSTDDECEHCFGHPEVRTRNRLEKQRRQRQQSCCGCCCNHCDGGQQRNRNNRISIEVIAPERDNNPMKEEEKLVIKNRNNLEKKDFKKD
ncbi:type 1 phosphatases regulator YPI1 [Drosophila ficusphila]|uniref:type 1 phosphatases regulator YPI1 n=1 Tax=Drosophila ficusphila TaxID=30025 RepID=UPI0007E7112C|nr:type 1 phosphatases regulator YPI1 [Drosophila ficusphila]